MDRNPTLATTLTPAHAELVRWHIVVPQSDGAKPIVCPEILLGHLELVLHRAHRMLPPWVIQPVEDCWLVVRDPVDASWSYTIEIDDGRAHYKMKMCVEQYSAVKARMHASNTDAVMTLIDLGSYELALPFEIATRLMEVLGSRSDTFLEEERRVRQTILHALKNGRHLLGSP